MKESNQKFFNKECLNKPIAESDEETNKSVKGGTKPEDLTNESKKKDFLPKINTSSCIMSPLEMLRKKCQTCNNSDKKEPEEPCETCSYDPK